MQSEQKAWNEFQKLPIEKRAEVIDFISFLHHRLIILDEETIQLAHHKRHFGCGKGMFSYVADDFDAPLEVFKDYMP